MKMSFIRETIRTTTPLGQEAGKIAAWEFFYSGYSMDFISTPLKFSCNTTKGHKRPCHLFPLWPKKTPKSKWVYMDASWPHKR